MFDLGEKVVCVNDKFPNGIHDIYNALPRKGKIYTVRDIVPAQDFKFQGTAGVLIEELVNRPNQHGIEPAFQCHRFREMTTEEVSISIEAEEPALA